MIWRRTGARLGKFGLVAVMLVAGPWIVGQPASAAATPTCAVVVPSAGATVSGTGVILSASASADTASVRYYLNGAYLGRALLTGYGWLYTPDNGQSWGWDSTTVANGAYALTCTATSSAGTGTSAPVQIRVANQLGCRVVAPDGAQPVSGNRVVISAAADVAGTTKVQLYLHSAATAVTYLGEAKPTAYGWLYTPDNGQSYGWDSTRVTVGAYRLTCVATANGARYGSPDKVFTVDNVTSHQWQSFCLDHVATTAADYEQAFAYRRGGWAGADGAHPISLPDGRVMWLFGDTLAGQIDASNALLPGWRMPSNSAVIQAGTCFTPLMGGTPQAPAHLLTDPAGNRFWPASGYVDTSVSPAVLRLTASKVLIDSSCGFGWRIGGVQVFTLSLPDLRVVATSPAPFNQSATNVPSFGAWLLRDGGHVYLYGSAGGLTCSYQENGPYPRGTYLARTTPAALATGPWEFRTATGWSSNIAAATAMSFDNDSALWYQATVRYGNGYLTTGRETPWGLYGPPVYAWFSASPAGPWTQLRAGGQPVNIVPSTVSFPQSRMFYGGIVHTQGLPGAAAAQPILVFSTNGVGCDPDNGVACTADNDIARNVMLYGPHSVRPVGLP